VSFPTISVYCNVAAELRDVLQPNLPTIHHLLALVVRGSAFSHPYHTRWQVLVYVRRTENKQGCSC